jgi:hypothetical protein
MVDDFWGEREWANFYENIKRVFPEREPVELPLEHEVFHCVYDLKKKPQVPASCVAGHRANDDNRPTPLKCTPALYDDKNRMMAIICHNTDIGDAWTRRRGRNTSMSLPSGGRIRWGSIFSLMR